MGAYRVADIWRVPSLISLLRLPLAAAFALTESPWAALTVLAAAGVSDMLDGWYARRFDQATPTGAVVDPITDKLFVLTVMITLWTRESTVAPWWLLCLATREIGELPLVAWFAVSQRARGERAAEARANAPGKVVTALQFATVTAALFRHALFVPLAVLTAVAGVFAAWTYWRRALTYSSESS